MPPPGADTPWSRHLPQSIHPSPKADTPHTPLGADTPQEQPPPPRADTSPWSRYPLRSACWEIRATTGRHASYWNAYLFLLNLEKKIFKNQPKQQVSFSTEVNRGMYLPISELIIMQRTASGRDYLTTSHARSENKWLDRITAQTAYFVKARNSSFKFHDCVTPVYSGTTFPFSALLYWWFTNCSVPCWLYLSSFHRENEQWSRIILWPFHPHQAPKSLRTTKLMLFFSVKTEIKCFWRVSFFQIFFGISSREHHSINWILLGNIV